MRTIYMLGHGKQAINPLITTLQHRGIQLLVDVRTLPHSRWAPWFNRVRLERALHEEGIGYRWLPSLGGLEPKPCAQILSTLTGLFRDQRTIALMCSEGDFTKCHRHYLLAPLVASLGYGVQQITPTGALVADPGPRQQQLADHDAEGYTSIGDSDGAELGDRDGSPVPLFAKGE